MTNSSHAQQRFISNIVDICQQLQQKGLTPSVALIKSKLATNVPMPIIIRGLSYWRQNPDERFTNVSEFEELPPTEIPICLERRVKMLEEEVRELRKILTLGSKNRRM